MNEQRQTQRRRSNVLFPLLGGTMLLLGAVIFVYSWITFLGQGSGAGFALDCLYLFVVLPFLITGGLFVLRSLMRKGPRIIVLGSGGILLLLGVLSFRFLPPGNPSTILDATAITYIIVLLTGPLFLIIGGVLVLRGLIRRRYN